MNQLELAITIAAKAHDNQVDKSGEPYILHPLRVMQAGKTDEERIVGMLHDVIEDTSVTAEDLLDSGFSQSIVDAVLALTRRGDESYSQFIDRAAMNPLAKAVKIADLMDNMRPSSDAGVAKYRRLRKYGDALSKLMEAA